MLHHLSIAVSELSRSAAFYDAVLGALGYRRVAEAPRFVGYGIEDGKDRFALKLRTGEVVAAEGFHLAFAAPDRSAVNPACWARALMTRAGEHGRTNRSSRSHPLRP